MIGAGSHILAQVTVLLQWKMSVWHAGSQDVAVIASHIQ
jgi:hypothetical protein